MNVLSLFDGMSCGQQALNRLGIKYDNYYASELDKYAIQITQKNFPDTIQLGDVCGVVAKDLPKDIDLLLAGSPCQGFSFAGKQLAFDDPRSALFFEFVRLLRDLKRKYFLLENVRMKKEYLDVITEQVSSCYTSDEVDDEFKDMFGNVRFEPILINSALVSAQNRVRYYWTNIPNVQQPEDKGIILRDILDLQEDDLIDNLEEKSHVIKAQYYKNSKANFETNNGFRATGIRQVGTAVDINRHDILKRVYSPDGKSPTLTAHGGGNTEPKVIVKSMTEVRTPEANKIRREHIKKTGKDWSPRHMRHLVERDDEKSNTITASMSKQHIIKVTSFREVRTEEAKRLRKEVRKKTGKDHTPFRAKKLVPREDGKVGTLTTSLTKDHKISLTRDTDKDVHWRKLTPLECERLQTVDDNYTEGVSNTQRYKMLGNGWTIDVISHILNHIK